MAVPECKFLGKPVLSFIAPAFRLLCHAHPSARGLRAQYRDAPLLPASPGTIFTIYCLAAAAFLAAAPRSFFSGSGLRVRWDRRMALARATAACRRSAR
jgi:hypothetical protein